MRKHRALALLFVLVATVAVAADSTATKSDVVPALKKGGYVLYLWHTQTNPDQADRPNLQDAVGKDFGEFDQFTDEFIAQAIEANRLGFGGGGSPNRGWSGVVCRDASHESATDGDKAAVHNWLERRPEVESFRLSDFWDVWHGADPFDTEKAPRKSLDRSGVTADPSRLPAAGRSPA